MLKEFLRSYKGYIIWYLLTISVFLTLSILYRIILEPTLYGILLITAGGIILGIFAWLRFLHKSKQLTVAAGLKQDIELFLPNPHDKLEEQYQELIRGLETQIIETSGAAAQDETERSDYYTMWIHQIKTPISALRLLLQAAQNRKLYKTANQTPEEEMKCLYEGMEQELFKIEQYAELVLSYLKIEKITNDLEFVKLNPFQVVKKVVKKYSILFIYKKITLQLEETDIKLLIDEKWLGFIIEQFISNAIKYTPSGGVIKIYWKNTDSLVVEDNGMGIRAEDLARVFERGYTGFNGRVDAKATGMGLYLSRRVAEKLGKRILLQSEQGIGTKVILIFPKDKIEIF